jgi:hypothetical protein
LDSSVVFAAHHALDSGGFPLMSAHSIAANFDALTKALGGSIFPHVTEDIRVITSRYRGGAEPLHIVSMPDGRFFKADNYDLDLLRKGWTPEDMQLCECGDSFPEDE